MTSQQHPEGYERQPSAPPAATQPSTGMTAIAELAGRGKLRPVIADTFPLADAAKAHALGETGHVAGKLVLTMH
jgi:NADPH:quinone reductase-like Zn-dependent oxidoreductase